MNINLEEKDEITFKKVEENYNDNLQRIILNNLNKFRNLRLYYKNNLKRIILNNLNKFRNLRLYYKNNLKRIILNNLNKFRNLRLYKILTSLTLLIKLQIINFVEKISTFLKKLSNAENLTIRISIDDKNNSDLQYPIFFYKMNISIWLTTIFLTYRLGVPVNFLVFLLWFLTEE